MTREEAKTVFLSRGYVEVEGGTIYDANKWRESCRVISEWLKQEPSRDIEEIKEIIKCDTDAEIKCKMISNILTAKPHYFEEQEPINKTVQKAYEDGKKDGYVQAKIEQELIVTSTNNSGEMIYPQVEGITSIVAEPIGDDYKHIKSISKSTGIEFDEEQEELDFVQPHKRIPITLTVSGYDKLIDLANAIENDDSGYWTNKKISSALRNISSIKPQPCEDTISRQAVLDIISELNAISFYEAQEDSKECYYEIRQAIKDLLPVKPQERTGYWIKHDTGHSIYYDCNLCSCLAPCTETADSWIWKLSNYCPDCGARMIEPQKGDKE